MIDARKTQFAQQLQQEAVASARASVLPAIRKGVLDDLIEERLKMQEAKKMSVSIEDSARSTTSSRGWPSATR